MKWQIIYKDLKMAIYESNEMILVFYLESKKLKDKKIVRAREEDETLPYFSRLLTITLIKIGVNKKDMYYEALNDFNQRIG